MDTLTSAISSGASGLLINSLSGRSNFTDTSVNNTSTSDISSTVLIVVIVLVILFLILFVVATYKLTGSTLQTILCILFGAIYILLAYLYYAFAGYKYLKPNRS
jgi:hypothetical protein